MFDDGHHATSKKGLEDAGYLVLSHADKMVSTPRVAFLVDENKKEALQKLFVDHRIELGYWYDTLPLSEKEIGEADLKVCYELIKSVINLPCHWTLASEEVDLMLVCIESLSMNAVEEDL